MTVEEIISRLQFIAKNENITIDNEALFVLAHKADGSMRDAQSLFDQVVSFCGTTIDAQQIMQALNIVDQELFFKVTSLIKSKESSKMLSVVEEIMSKGYDFKDFINGYIEHLRNLLIARSTGSVNFIEASDVYKDRYKEECTSFTETDLLRLIKIANDTENAIKWSQQPRYKLEIALLQMQKMDSSIQIQDLLHQLGELKKKLNSGSTHKSPPQEQGFAQNYQQDEQTVSKPSQAKTAAVSSPFSSGVKAQSSEPFTRYGTQQEKTQKQAVAQPIEQILTPIKSEDAFDKWQSFVSDARKQKIHVGTMLSESKLLEVKDNRFKIICPDDFHLETFKRNREFLFSLAEQVYGAKVRLDAIVSGEDFQSSSSNEYQGISETDTRQTQNKSDILQHPTTQMIMKEFECQVIE